MPALGTTAVAGAPRIVDMGHEVQQVLGQL